MFLFIQVKGKLRSVVLEAGNPCMLRVRTMFHIYLVCDRKGGVDGIHSDTSLKAGARELSEPSLHQALRGQNVSTAESLNIITAM